MDEACTMKNKLLAAECVVDSNSSNFPEDCYLCICLNISIATSKKIIEICKRKNSYKSFLA